jgi:hypothetical protein
MQIDASLLVEHSCPSPHCALLLRWLVPLLIVGCSSHGDKLPQSADTGRADHIGYTSELFSESASVLPDSRQTEESEVFSLSDLDVAEPHEEIVEIADLEGAESQGEILKEPDYELLDYGGEVPCVPQCDDTTCGSDGCGGICVCSQSQHICLEGNCVCVPNCESKECGADGCAGTCGQCADYQVCIAGKCPPEGQECSDGNEQDWDGCTQGVISETVMDLGSLSKQQVSPDVAELPGGGLGVVWHRYNQGMTGADIAYSTIPVSIEATQTHLVSTSESSLCFPRIATNQNFGVVIWGGSGEPPSDETISGRLLDSSGIPTGAQVELVLAPPGIQGLTAVEVLANGNIAVAWQAKDLGIAAQWFDPSLVPLGPPFVLDADTSGVQGFVELVSLAPDTALAVWHRGLTPGPGDWPSTCDVRSRLLPDSSSGPSLGVTVNDFFLACQAFPDVAAASGGAIAVWNSCPPECLWPLTGCEEFAQDGDQCGVFGRFTDLSGEPVGDEFMLSQSGIGAQFEPTVGSLKSGSMLMVWMHTKTDTTELVGRIFDSSGQPQSDETILTSHPAPMHRSPRVIGVESTESFAIVWEAKDNSGHTDVLFLRVDASLNKLYH